MNTFKKILMVIGGFALICLLVSFIAVLSVETTKQSLKNHIHGYCLKR